MGECPVCEHRDFSPWNVLLDSKGELVVLDWESAELHGLPCLDLVYFLTFLSFFIDGAMDSGLYLDSFRSQLDPDSFTGRVVEECQQRYINSVGLDRAVLPPLRLFAWTFHSLSEYKRLSEDKSGRLESEDLQRSLFLQLWREELERIPEKPHLEVARRVTSTPADTTIWLSRTVPPFVNTTRSGLNPDRSSLMEDSENPPNPQPTAAQYRQ
jgi:hypothetical protein